MQYKTDILVVEHTAAWQEKLRKLLDSDKCEVQIVGSYEEARSLIYAKKFEIIVLDLDLGKGEVHSARYLQIQMGSKQQYAYVIALGDDASLERAKNGHESRQFFAVFSRNNFNPKEFLGLVENVVDQHSSLEKRTRTLPQYHVRRSNYFTDLLKIALDRYSLLQGRSVDDVVDELNDELGYGRNSMAIQYWLRENAVPPYDDLNPLAKKFIAYTDLGKEWIHNFRLAAGLEIVLTPSTDDLWEDTLRVASAHTVIPASVSLANPSQTTVSASFSLARPVQVFISYARADVDIVSNIYQTLLDSKHDSWMDIYSIKGGEDWLRAIYRAIEECPIFLAVLSNNSVSRRGVIQKELRKALDKWEGMLPDDIYIIPVRIDDCPIPDLLKHIQVLDWNNGKGENKLLEAVRVGLAKRKDG
jgi:hypothetical protein